jgi:hypothetical protein
LIGSEKLNIMQWKAHAPWIRSKVHDLRRSCPGVIPSLSPCEDFPKGRFWLALELEINCRVIMVGRILLSFRGFFEE